MRSAIVFANRARALSFFVWRHATATSEKNRNGYRFPSCLNRHLNRNAYEKTTSLKCLSNHEFKWKLSAKNSAPFSSMFLYIVPHKQNDIILFCILSPTNKMTSFFYAYVLNTRTSFWKQSLRHQVFESRMAMYQTPRWEPQSYMIHTATRNEANQCLLFTRLKATIHTKFISLEASQDFIPKFILQAKQEPSKPKAFKPVKPESCNASHEASQKLDIPRLEAT